MNNPNYPEIPDGWRLVPVEATQDIIYAISDAIRRDDPVWPAALAAAPVPPDVARSELSAGPQQATHQADYWIADCSGDFLYAERTKEAAQSRSANDRMGGRVFPVKIMRDATAPALSAQQAARVAWCLTQGEVRTFAAELVRGAEAMGGDEDELILEVRSPGTVADDDGALNVRHILALSLAEYPEEGVYPIDPTDPTGGRVDAAPAPSASPAALAPTALADYTPLVRFVKHLSENCIGQVVSEDALEEWALDVLDSTPREVTVRPGPPRLVASDQTAARQQSATQPEPAALTDEEIQEREENRYWKANEPDRALLPAAPQPSTVPQAERILACALQLVDDYAALLESEKRDALRQALVNEFSAMSAPRPSAKALTDERAAFSADM